MWGAAAKPKGAGSQEANTYLVGPVRGVPLPLPQLGRGWATGPAFAHERSVHERLAAGHRGRAGLDVTARWVLNQEWRAMAMKAS